MAIQPIQLNWLRCLVACSESYLSLIHGNRLMSSAVIPVLENPPAHGFIVYKKTVAQSHPPFHYHWGRPSYKSTHHFAHHRNNNTRHEKIPESINLYSYKLNCKFLQALILAVPRARTFVLHIRYLLIRVLNVSLEAYKPSFCCATNSKYPNHTPQSRDGHHLWAPLVNIVSVINPIHRIKSPIH